MWLPWRKKDATDKPDTGNPLAGKSEINWDARSIPRFERWSLMADDPQIKLGLAAFDAPIIGIDWFVECAAPSDSDADQALAAEIAKWTTAEVADRWRTWARMNLLKRPYGRIGGVKRFEIGEDGKYHVELKDKPPRSTTPLTDENDDLRGVKLGSTDVGLDYAFLFVNDERFGDKNGRSVFTRALEDRWRWCENLYEICNRYYERRADPPIKARAPGDKRRDTEGNEYSPMDKMDDAIKALRSGGHAVLSTELMGKGDKYAYDAEFMLDDQRGAMFLIYIQHLEVMKLRGLLVPERTVTQDQSTGSYGMAEAHVDMFITMVETAAGDLVKDFNEQVIDQLVVANWGQDAPRAYLRVSPLNDRVKAFIRQIFQGLAQSYPQALVAILDLLKVCESMEVPLVEGAQERLDAIQAAMVKSMGTVPTSGTVPPSVQLQDRSHPGAGVPHEPDDPIDVVIARYGPKAGAFFEKLRERLAGVGGSGRPFLGAGRPRSASRS